MDSPTTLADLLPYILHLIAPYLLSGPILSHALEQLPFFNDVDETNPEGKYPDWLQLAAVYGICLFLVVVNGILSGAFANGITGTLIQTTLASTTAFMATTTLTHLSVNDFLPSLAKWFNSLLANTIATITKMVHPGSGTGPGTVEVKTETTVSATDQGTGQVLTGTLEPAQG